jgi:hypothetical protein
MCDTSLAPRQGTSSSDNSRPRVPHLECLCVSFTAAAGYRVRCWRENVRTRPKQFRHRVRCPSHVSSALRSPSRRDGAPLLATPAQPRLLQAGQPPAKQGAG